MALFRCGSGSSGGGTSQVVVTGTFSCTNSTEVTISGISQIDFILTVLNNTITVDSDNLFSYSGTNVANLVTRQNSTYIKDSRYAAAYKSQGIQQNTINGNKFTFLHWNSNVQTVNYYVIGR